MLLVTTVWVVEILTTDGINFSAKSANELGIVFEFEIIEKLKVNINVKKNHWIISAEHDGYLKRYGIIHSRKIECFLDQNRFVGLDKIIRKKKW